MDNKSIRRLLDSASTPPYVEIEKYVSSTTSKANFLFSFRYLILNYDNFPCYKVSYNRKGRALVNIFATLVDASKNNRFSIQGRDHCHDVGEQRLIGNNLQALVDKFTGKQFFQFGQDGCSERVIGFFSDENTHLFEVCLLDLNHDIFPPKKRRVYDN